MSHWLSLGFQNVYSQALECNWSSLSFHIRSCPWPLAYPGPMDVIWSSREKEPRAGPFPLERWLSGCSGTDWYLKANRISISIALHGGPEAQSSFCSVIASGKCSEQCSISISNFPSHVFANKDKRRICAINYVIESQTLLSARRQTKTHPPKQKPGFYFHLHHPEHSRILPAWPRQIAPIFCFFACGVQAVSGLCLWWNDRTYYKKVGTWKDF